MKLKQMLMEKLNEYENQLLIIDALKHERKEIKLQGITKLTTS
jgi:hypothetical protein